MSAKADRRNLPHIHLPVFPVEVRLANPLGLVTGVFTDEQAMAEAGRCLECSAKKPLDSPCTEECRLHIRMALIEGHVMRGEWQAAMDLMADDNPFPEWLGRFCYAECTGGEYSVDPLATKGCVYNAFAKKQRDSGVAPELHYKPVEIRGIEDRIAERMMECEYVPSVSAPKGRRLRIAIIGSGPAGAAVAYDAARAGHEAVIFEAENVPGGVLVYGIPMHRLPRERIAYSYWKLQKLGVKFEYNVLVGPAVTPDELLTKYGFDVVVIATGAGLPNVPKIKGMLGAKGFEFANSLLYAFNIYGSHAADADMPLQLRGKPWIYGAGDTAADVFSIWRRTALLRGQQIIPGIMYHGNRQRVRMAPEEQRNIMAEGAVFTCDTKPLEVLKDEHGFIRGFRCVKTVSGPRGEPEEIPDTMHEIDGVHLAPACGSGPNPLLLRHASDIQRREGYVLATRGKHGTSRRRIFACGDALYGEKKTVVDAIASGRETFLEVEAELAVVA